MFLIFVIFKGEKFWNLYEFKDKEPAVKFVEDIQKDPSYKDMRIAVEDEEKVLRPSALE